MARTSRRLSTNVDGPVFVDDTCIDCGTCRWMAPEVFDHLAGASRVHAQPADEASRARALRALIDCPTNSIGTLDKRGVRDASASFPFPFDGPVHHCGFHAEASFGATAWLILRDEGHILVDSPRFAAPLVRQLDRIGPIKWMFLTHRDDVADHARFAEHFGCTRVIHRDDVTADTRDVEIQLDGPTELAPGV